MPWYSSNLAGAYAKLERFDDAWRCIDEAITTVESAKEKVVRGRDPPNRWRNRSDVPEPDAAKAEAYFEHALAVAREQQATSRPTS
jgi:hypothetical protein